MDDAIDIKSRYRGKFKIDYFTFKTYRLIKIRE